MFRFGLFFVLGFMSCAPAAPARGELLEQGVARAVFEVRARHTDLVRVPVYFPSDEQGRPQGSGLRALVFIQGGLVSAQRYEWLARALARAGWVVAMPEHPSDLAFFSVDNGRFARELLTGPPAGSLLEGGLVDPNRVAVGGHSLGGVVAAKLALQGGFGALALLASYPDPADSAAIPRLGIPSLTLAGRSDCTARLALIDQRSAALPSPTARMVLEGVTHYQFTNDDQPDRDKECLPGLGLDEAHLRIATALERFLQNALDRLPLEAAGLEQIPGAEVSFR